MEHWVLVYLFGGLNWAVTKENIPRKTPPLTPPLKPRLLNPRSPVEILDSTRAFFAGYTMRFFFGGFVKTPSSFHMDRSPS